MQDKEREILRQHIIWLGTQLESQRKANQDKVVFLKRLLDPEDLGHATSTEVRQLAYQIIINEHHLDTLFLYTTLFRSDRKSVV